MRPKGAIFSKVFADGRQATKGLPLVVGLAGGRASRKGAFPHGKRNASFRPASKQGCQQVFF
ncbi:MAG: hypothetical protein MJZ86_01010 [Bacteroidales bacterium]|nr:hypothetical protein [Bacteroidales bacterium]